MCVRRWSFVYYPIQRQVQLQHIDARLAQQAELRTLRVFRDELADDGRIEATGARYAGA